MPQLVKCFNCNDVFIQGGKHSSHFKEPKSSSNPQEPTPGREQQEESTLGRGWHRMLFYSKGRIVGFC
ncbi:unnamed protein product [Linum trigynum]|uniref:C2H2-type domain-containing protein n=1 Tax=Linum trigynum TaxID=586398 RepID=A0AAV2CMS0_9ROSI